MKMMNLKGKLSLNLDSGVLITCMALCGLTIALTAWGDEGRFLLRYERGAILDGQLWRLVSGHFVHLGWGHLGLNLAGLALLTLIFRRYYGLTRWLLIAAVSMACIDAGFLALQPGLRWYVGLSGILHGVMAAGIFALCRRREAGGVLLAAFLLGKLIWEQISGPMSLSAEAVGGPVIVDAHLYGAVGGLFAALLPHRKSRTAAL